MTESTDWRGYALSLLQRWPVVAIVTIIALMIATIVNLVMEPRYRGEVIMVASPKYQWRVEARIQDFIDRRFDRRDDYLELLDLDEAAERVMQRMAGNPETRHVTVKDFEGSVNVRKLGGQLLRLQATDRTPEVAATLANTWAEVWGEMAAEHFSAIGDLAAFHEDLRQAEQELAERERALETFRREEGFGLDLTTDLVVDSRDELFSSTNVDAIELALQNSARAGLRFALAQMRHVMTEAQGLASTAPVERLQSLHLLDTSAVLRRRQITPQILRDDFSTVGALLNQLQTLEEDLVAELELLDQQAAATQAKLAWQKTQNERLWRLRTEQQETYDLWRRKVIELEAQIRLDGPPLTIVSYAQPPERAAFPNWLVSLGLAMVLGVTASGLFVVLMVGPPPRRQVPAERQARRKQIRIPNLEACYRTLVDRSLFKRA